MGIPSLSKQQIGLLLRACLSCRGVPLRGGQFRTAKSLERLELGRLRTERGVSDGPDVGVFHASSRGRKVAPHVLPDRRVWDRCAP